MKRALAVFWVFAGVMHFVRPAMYEQIVPPPLDDYSREVVYASGVAEIVGGLAVNPAPRFARWWLLATLAAVFPANVWMALNADRFPQIPAAGLWGRLPFQFAFAWFVIKGTEED